MYIYDKNLRQLEFFDQNFTRAKKKLAANRAIQEFDQIIVRVTLPHLNCAPTTNADSP